MGKDGAEDVAKQLEDINEDNVEFAESCAARDYFTFYHKGLNRRVDDPVNSRLNYGYAVVRSAIARELVSVGFHPTFGIHHDSQLNAFNLADDLIEPYRPMVDMAANECIGSNVRLNKSERRELASVLHNACMVDDSKVSIMAAIELSCESLKRIILNGSTEELSLPTILPLERTEVITE